MPQVITVGFSGVVTPARQSAVAVHCRTCGLRVFDGHGAVNVAALQHTCQDTTSQLAEFELVWEIDPSMIGDRPVEES